MSQPAWSKGLLWSHSGEGHGWLNSARKCTRPMEKPSQVLRLVKESLWSSLHIKAGLNMSLQSSKCICISKCPIPDYQQHYRVTYMHTYIHIYSILTNLSRTHFTAAAAREKRISLHTLNTKPSIDT